MIATRPTCACRVSPWSERLYRLTADHIEDDLKLTVGKT